MPSLQVALYLAGVAVLVLGFLLGRRLWNARRRWFAVGAVRVVTVDESLPAVFVITTRGRDGVWLYSLTDDRSYPVTWRELGGGKDVELQQPRTAVETGKDHGATSISEIAKTVLDARAALEATAQTQRTARERRPS